ncbi:hypothetical protein I302_100094 [Kwoniella bestiolae CBS 10118]|uniref:Uncharacterized protein n=1 Tax=Kwoniella bestiolae CBS 10118 TaxID=1296100 RepID=A0A1B9G437_9TREE|nr:hypothetical protein I302_03467 [Kwoniella bestiolae CBS 10118]OCF25794.1 hypothetical protein I302_03467 [Kwoniella bestiolae CBS 10118]
MEFVVDILSDAAADLLEFVSALTGYLEKGVVESRMRAFTYNYNQASKTTSEGKFKLEEVESTDPDLHKRIRMGFEPSRSETYKIRKFVESNVIRRWRCIADNDVVGIEEHQNNTDQWYKWGKYMKFDDCKISLPEGTGIELSNPEDRLDSERLTIPHSKQADEQVKVILEEWERSSGDSFNLGHVHNTQKL